MQPQELTTRNQRRFYVSESINFIFFLVILVLATSLAVEKSKSPNEHAPCLDNWIGYLGKCFYFSENTMTWAASQNFCTSHTATLAVFNTTKELEFLKQYADSSQYWIGLSGKEGQAWQWTDGTTYASRFKITGKGEYAYLHKNGITSASSHLLKKWICSKLDMCAPIKTL